MMFHPPKNPKSKVKAWIEDQINPDSLSHHDYPSSVKKIEGAEPPQVHFKPQFCWEAFGEILMRGSYKFKGWRVSLVN